MSWSLWNHRTSSRLCMIWPFGHDQLSRYEKRRFHHNSDCRLTVLGRLASWPLSPTNHAQIFLADTHEVIIEIPLCSYLPAEFWFSHKRPFLRHSQRSPQSYTSARSLLQRSTLHHKRTPANRISCHHQPSSIPTPSVHIKRPQLCYSMLSCSAPCCNSFCFLLISFEQATSLFVASPSILCSLVSLSFTASTRLHQSVISFPSRLHDGIFSRVCAGYVPSSHSARCPFMVRVVRRTPPATTVAPLALFWHRWLCLDLCRSSQRSSNPRGSAETGVDSTMYSLLASFKQSVTDNVFNFALAIPNEGICAVWYSRRLCTPKVGHDLRCLFAICPNVHENQIFSPGLQFARINPPSVGFASFAGIKFLCSTFSHSSNCRTRLVRPMMGCNSQNASESNQSFPMWYSDSCFIHLSSSTLVVAWQNVQGRRSLLSGSSRPLESTSGRSRVLSFCGGAKSHLGNTSTFLTDHRSSGYHSSAWRTRVCSSIVVGHVAPTQHSWSAGSTCLSSRLPQTLGALFSGQHHELWTPSLWPVYL